VATIWPLNGPAQSTLESWDEGKVTPEQAHARQSCRLETVGLSGMPAPQLSAWAGINNANSSGRSKEKDKEGGGGWLTVGSDRSVARVRGGLACCAGADQLAPQRRAQLVQQRGEPRGGAGQQSKD